MDDLVVVVNELGEAEDVAVEVDEPIHVAERDVADAVVDFEEVHSRRRNRRLLDLAEARSEDPVVVVPLDEAVADLAIREDRGAAENPVLATVEIDRLDGRAGAPLRGLGKRRARVVDEERDVLDAVAVAMDVLGDLGVGRQGAGQDERDVVAPHHVARAIANTRLKPGIGDRREAPQGSEVVGGLARVTDPELDVVNALERQEVLCFLVGVLVEVRAGLVGGPPWDRLGHVAVSCGPAAGREGLGPGRAATERRPGTRPGWCDHPCYADVRDWGMDDPVGRLHNAGTDLLALRGALVAGEPWPLSAAYGTEPEADWGPREVLAHVNEMLGYWPRQLSLVLAADPATAVPLGRIAADAGRIRRIEIDRERPAAELLDEIDASLASAITFVDDLTPADLERRGVHPSRGEISVGQGIAAFLTDHLEGHVVQLREILDRADRA